MNSFDLAIVEFLNGFALYSFKFDLVIMHLSQSDLLKGGVVSAMIWWAWFRGGPETSEPRGHVVATLAASLVAILAGRGLQGSLPFRARPMQEPALEFVLPYGVPPNWWDTHTSMPSDHAVLFVAIALGLMFVSRRLGLLALAYVTVVIMLPRVYLGFHYPTDILAGALVGALICLAFNLGSTPAVLGRATSRFREKHPAPFYVAFFLLTLQITVLFQDLRNLGSLVERVLEL